METLMVVGCDPLPDRVDELNRWYSWVHIRDVMRLPGSLSAQRFALSPVQPATDSGTQPFTYLTLYEIADKTACNKGHFDDCFTDRMPISTAFDFQAFHEAYFDPLPGAGERLDPRTAEQPVMLITLAASDANSLAFEQILAAGGLQDIAELPGFAATTAFRFGTDQMMALPARHSHLILCHLSDLSLAIACWNRFAGDLPSTWQAVDKARLRGEAYLPLMPRLQAQDVLSEPEHVRSIAAQERASVGNDVHRPGANAFM
ncbi:hypothetical protein SAMN02927924_00324 [Sphingobium faniae]|nr:hypothetical protein SAMN02927924_00324 [Sphingobium faniae]